MGRVEQHDPHGDDRGRDGAPVAEPLAEDDGADERGDDHAGLAERGHDRERAPGLRPDHQPVGGQRQHPADEPAGEVGPQAGLQVPPAPGRRVQGQGQPLRQEQPGDVADRAARPPHAQPVGDGVGGDGHAGRQREPDRPAVRRENRRAGHPDQQDQAEADDQHPGQAQRPEPLAHHQAGETGHQQRRAAAGERIDLAEVAAGPVGLDEQQLVAGMDQGRERDEDPARACRARQQGHRERAQDDAGEVQQHEGGQAVLAALEQGVPGGVQHRGQQDHRGDRQRGGGLGGVLDQEDGQRMARWRPR